MPNLARSPPLNKSLSMTDLDTEKVGDKPTCSSGESVHNIQREKKRRRVTDDVVSPKSSEPLDIRTIIREELSEILKTLQIQQNLRMDAIEKHISEIKIQNDTNLKKNIDIEKSIEFVAAKMEEVQHTINCLEKDRNDISAQITTIETKCDTLDRLARKTSIQIRNVPRQKAESKEKLFEMINKLSTSLGINMGTSDVRDIYRLPSKPDQVNTTIVAEFSSTLTRSYFLSAAKDFKSSSIKFKTEQLNSTHLGIEAPKSEIYLSEHLTPICSRLFYLAREFRKTMGYDYCWTSNGLVYLRKKQGEPYILIKNEAQLQILGNK
ncbi:unnamed protein product [Chilo suppressalis]|uniref:FP protein C-terminal domain-containing protein n=1 Tax=Chilo suppressalis TaxID=168631 RepID=A0ABN8AYT3_CHISP|nr:unnamed protein product [Chilo suppressalis]